MQAAQFNVPGYNYELEMLEATYNLLASGAFAKYSKEDNIKNTLKNALIESFCLHARNLIEFYDNDICKDVVASASKLFQYKGELKISKKKKEQYLKVGKELPHYNRLCDSLAHFLDRADLRKKHVKPITHEERTEMLEEINKMNELLRDGLKAGIEKGAIHRLSMNPTRVALLGQSPGQSHTTSSMEMIKVGGVAKLPSFGP